jgi:hypothetical protein
MVKVIMTWNIQENKEQEYIEFAVSELSPTLSSLGLQINDVWYTIIGNGPEMVVSGLMPTRAEAEQMLQSGTWMQIRSRLHDYVEDIKIKIVKPNAPFQM